MVLWEITLGTAYFLGLKRTYRLALKIQRCLINPNKHPKIRQFVHGRTRAVFDVAVQVHQNIQQRDLEVGRSFGNWILRWLDQVKPSAQICSPLTGKPPPAGISNTSMMKLFTNSSSPPKTMWGFPSSSLRWDRISNRPLFSSLRNMWPRPFPTIAMMMRPGTNIQYRSLSFSGAEALRSSYRRRAAEGVIRKDILQWMLQQD